MSTLIMEPTMMMTGYLSLYIFKQRLNSYYLYDILNFGIQVECVNAYNSIIRVHKWKNVIEVTKTLDLTCSFCIYSLYWIK